MDYTTLIAARFPRGFSPIADTVQRWKSSDSLASQELMRLGKYEPKRRHTRIMPTRLTAFQDYIAKENTRRLSASVARIVLDLPIQTRLKRRSRLEKEGRSVGCQAEEVTMDV